MGVIKATGAGVQEDWRGRGERKESRTRAEKQGQGLGGCPPPPEGYGDKGLVRGSEKGETDRNPSGSSR